MFKGPIEDRLAIRELNETYCDCVLRGDAAEWGSCWAEDARWEFMGKVVDGRDAIVGLWSGAMGTFRAVSFIAITCALEVEGDRARGRCQTHEVIALPDGTTRMLGGRYDDEYVKAGGRWLYARRKFSIVAEYNPQEG